MHAASTGRLEIVKLLLSSEARLSLKQTNFFMMSAFHMACRNNYVETARLLLRAGADCNQCDMRGLTPLMAACKKRPLQKL